MKSLRTISLWTKRGALVASLCGALLATGVTAAHADGGHRGSASARAAQPTVVVNLNTASEADLEGLPGIGPSKAKAILALRKRIGRFQRVEQILRVRGIGRATFRKLRPMLKVGGQGGRH